MNKILIFLILTISFRVIAQAPANDNCSGAISLTVNNDNLCAVSTTGTSVGATQGMSGCGISSVDDDVWYSFVATATSHKIEVTPLTLKDPVFQVFSGACNSLTSLECVNASFQDTAKEKSILSGLTIGNTYFVRVYSRFSGSTVRGTFSICVGIPVPPTNDNCGQAIALSVNSGDNCALSTNASSEDATQSLAACKFGSTADDDVWFSFTATSTAHKIRITPNSMQAPIVEIFEGSCGNLNSLYCSSSSENTITIGSLNPGQNYFIRVYSYRLQGTFNLCVSTPQNRPPNDECSGAIQATVNSASCSQVVSGNLENATGNQSSSCNGLNTIKDDVWFRFTATDTRQLIQLKNLLFSNFLAYIQLFSGSCGNLQSIQCINGKLLLASNLVIGQEYYVRVWSAFGVNAGQGTFDLCISTPQANSLIANALTIPVNSDFTCTQSISTENTFAFSSETTSSQCGAVMSGVWYKFTANNDSLKLTITPGTISSQTVEVYHNNNGNLSFIAATDQNNLYLTTLSPGQEYYVLVYNCGDNPNHRGTFSLCLRQFPAPPSNNSCGSATVLTPVSATSCSNPTSGSTINAFGRIFGCSGSSDDAVWYSFTATSDRHMVSVSAGTLVNPVFEVFVGDCNSLSLIACVNEDFGNGTETRKLTGLTISQTYFIKVYSEANDTGQGTFDICVFDAPPLPPNDDCENAIVLQIGDCVNGSNVGIETTNYDNCAEFEKRNVWYKFTATAASMSLTLTRGTIQNVAIDVWQGGCFGTFSFSSCDIGNNNAVITKNISGLTIGQEYFLTVSTRVTHEEGTFSLCLNSLPPPSNNLCQNAQNLNMNGPAFPINFTSGTTQFADGDLLACNANFMARDVWFSFTATQSTHLVFLKTGTLFGARFEVFSGDCNNINSIFCSTNNFTNSDFSSQEVPGLTPGQTYKIRVYSIANSGTQMGSFSMAVAEMQVNDECQGAQTLNYNLENSNVVLETKILTTLSRSNNVDCHGNGDTGEKKDVWYKFVPNTHSAFLYFKSLTSGTFYSFSIQKGSCGNLSCVGRGYIGTFSDTLSFLINNLEIGATYYVRIRYDGALSPNSFGIFIKAFSEPKCKNASTLLLSNRDNPIFKSDSIHHNPDPFYNYLLPPADSTVVLNPNLCNPENANWYKFTPQSANQMLWIETFVLNAQFTIKTGTCDNLTTYSDCEEISPGKVKNLANLQVGQNYYLVLGAENTPSLNDNLSYGNIKIAITNSIPPANEICNNALTLNICNSGDSCRTEKFYSNLSAATASSTCTAQSGAAVWFKFVATASSINAILENLTFDAYVDLFGGSCSNPQLLSCNLQGGVLHNVFEMSNLQIGSTYFLKVYSHNPLLFKINLVKPGEGNLYPFQDQGCLGVNLVTDPGFEKQSTCPNLFVPTPATPGQSLNAGSEWTIPSTGSPDRFSSCAFFEATIDVPRNPTFGIQYPFAGKSYAGFFASSGGYREYLKHTLSDSLQPGKTYLLSMYVSRGDYNVLAQNGLGFGLSVNSLIFNGNTVILTDTAIIATGNPIVSNSEKWTRLTATFTADKKYKHLYLGNFRNQANSQTQFVGELSGGINGGYDGIGSVNLRSYYFVDEVFVGELKDQIACNANPCNQNLTLVSPQDNISNATVQKITNQEIKANIIIQGTSNVLLKAGKSILMDSQQGVFEVKSGVVFEAKIGGCTN